MRSACTGANGAPIARGGAGGAAAGDGPKLTIRSVATAEIALIGLPASDLSAVAWAAAVWTPATSPTSVEALSKRNLLITRLPPIRAPTIRQTSLMNLLNGVTLFALEAYHVFTGPNVGAFGRRAPLP